MHIQLKRDLAEQAAVIKQQQEQIYQLCIERDAAQVEPSKRRGGGAPISEIKLSLRSNTKLQFAKDNKEEDIL